MSAGDYQVGKNRPPKHTQFKTGQPPPPGAGRPKAKAVHVVNFFDEPVTVPLDGRATKMPSSEVALTNLANRAIKGDMRAARRFLGLCSDAGLLTGDPSNDGPTSYLVNTNVWDLGEWEENFRRLGPPPWDGPRNGLYNENWREEAMCHG